MRVNEGVQAAPIDLVGRLVAGLRFQVPGPGVIEARLLAALTVLVHEIVDIQRLGGHACVFKPHLKVTGVRLGSRGVLRIKTELLYVPGTY